MSFPFCPHCGTELAPGRGCIHFPVPKESPSDQSAEPLSAEEWDRIYLPEGIITRDEDLPPKLRRILNPRR